MTGDQRRARIPGARYLIVMSTLVVFALQLFHQPQMPVMILFVGPSASVFSARMPFLTRGVGQRGGWLRIIALDAVIAFGQYLFMQEIGGLSHLS